MLDAVPVIGSVENTRTRPRRLMTAASRPTPGLTTIFHLTLPKKGNTDRNIEDGGTFPSWKGGALRLAIIVRVEWGRLTLVSVRLNYVDCFRHLLSERVGSFSHKLKRPDLLESVRVEEP